jgi:hypothetical protein
MRPISLFMLLVTLGIALGACTANRTDESRKDREMALLNQRKYGQSVNELETSLRQNPNDRSTALLLAMAHIGEANAEMLQLFSSVLKAQGAPPPELLARVRCNDEPWDNLQDKSAACIASRILRNVPDELNADMARSQQLLRQYYPDARATKSDVNFLAAYVEVYRFLNRFNYLTNPRTWADAEGLKLDNKKFDDVTTPEFEKADAMFGLGVHELKNLGDEFMQAYKRLQHSYGKLAKYTSSINGKPIIQYKGHVLIFDEDMSVDRIAKFVLTVLNDEQGKADKKLNENFSGILSRLAPAAVRLARELEYVSGPTEAWNHITTSFQFENLLKNFLRGLSLGSGRVPSADLSGWMIDELDTAGDELLKNPPGLFGDFAKAMRESWNTESMRALSAYHKATAPEWLELSEIIRLWGKVRDNDEDSFEGRKMAHDLVSHREADHNYLKFPATVTPVSIDGWFREILAEGAVYERGYEAGKYSPNNRPPSPARRALVHEAWTRSNAWLAKNVLLQR